MDCNEKLGIEDIKNALHKADMLLRPYIVFVNPKDKDFLLSTMPNIEKQFVIESNSAIEQGKAFLIKREELEDWCFAKGVI